MDAITFNEMPEEEPMDQPGPDAEVDRGEAPQPETKRSRSRHQTRDALPTTDRLLAQLATIVRMTLTGTITPAQAGAMRSSIEVQLRFLQSAQKNASTTTQFDVERWREAAKHYPDLVSDLAPFFTDDAIDELFGLEDEEPPTAEGD